MMSCSLMDFALQAFQGHSSCFKPNSIDTSQKRLSLMLFSGLLRCEDENMMHVSRL